MSTEQLYFLNLGAESVTSWRRRWLGGSFSLPLFRFAIFSSSVCFLIRFDLEEREEGCFDDIEKKENTQLPKFSMDSILSFSG